MCGQTDPIWDEREQVKPCLLSNCAFCIGLPMDRESMLRSLQHDGDETFAMIMARDKPRTVSYLNELWNEYFDQVIVPVKGACEKFESQFGITVLTNTTLESLHQLTMVKDAVVLLTHWLPPRFVPADILEPEQFLQLAEEDGHWVNRDVKKAIASMPRSVWPPFAKPVDLARKQRRLPEFVADALNRLIDHVSYPDQPDAATVYRDNERAGLSGRAGLGAITRVLVEARFGKTIAWGRCMEFSNGMNSPWPLIHQPDTHPFVMDLSMCMSTQFSEIARIRPRMRVIGHFELTAPAPCMLLLDRTFQILSERRHSYLEARALAMIQLRKHFRELK
jgi:hypothetical protein